jgi:riboflavin kinase/FMN adenylyltransferase
VPVAIIRRVVGVQPTSSVVALGVFDGVHRGHRLIVSRAVANARTRGLPTVIVSFDPHPAAVLRPEVAPLMLTTLDRRVTLLRSLGADDVVVLPFTRELSAQTPEDFARIVLRESLHADRGVVGEYWRFGHKAAGDVALLRELGFDVEAVDLLSDGEVVSSSAIRAMVSAGNVAAAAAAMDRPHVVEGPVVRGDARGRDLGYPTANVAVDRGIVVPADGVYAGWLVRDGGEGSRLPTAVSVGTNPTFQGAERRVEAFVLDADLDLYEEHVVVEFVARLRGMVRFETVEALVAQMAGDVEATRTALFG